MGNIGRLIENDDFINKIVEASEQPVSSIELDDVMTLNDDIVKQLQDWAYIIDGIQGQAQLVMLSGIVFTEAAEEIQRLREYGDLLETAIRTGIGIDDALDKWSEARRG